MVDQAQQLRDEVDRVGRLIEAGHRGIPIGGELLVAFGVTIGLLGCFAMATAFGYLPPDWMPSPVAAAAALLAFAVLFRSAKQRLASTLFVAAAVATACDLAWRAALAAVRSGEPELGPSGTMSLFIAVPLLMILLGAVIGLWRLKRSAHAVSPANRALIGAWLGLAAAVAATIALCGIVGARTNNWFGFMFLPGLFWIAWGSGWWTSAAATRSRWMYGVAAGSWALAMWYAATFDFYTTSIVGLAALTIAPGVQLLHEAREAHEA
jgi:hypothetical protein